MAIDPVRGKLAVPGGTGAVTAPMAPRPAQPAPAAAQSPADGPASTSRVTAPPPETTRDIERLRPPLNAIMAQLGGQAFLGARLLRGVPTADLPAALSRGLVKPDPAMRAAAESLQHLLSGVDTKA